MSLKQKLVHELKSVGYATLYFACWIGTLLLLKKLILADYDIQFHHMGAALVGALVLSKVVLVLEKVPLGSWTQRAPAWVGVVARTTLYGVGVAIVLLLEKAIEGRHEHGGFAGSVANVLQHKDINHVWANLICISGALLVFNAMAILRLHLGEGGISRIFLTPPPLENESSRPE